MNKKLHIVCFDTPFPPDYGGVMDVYATAAGLHARGVEVVLHCFEYGSRKRPAEQPGICSEIHYYPRRKLVSLSLPYIVASRKNEELNQRLLADDAPVLLEGVHCSLPALDKRFAGKKMVVRSFNVETEYYAGLARHSTSLLKRWYYKVESRLLERYEERLVRNATVLTISEADLKYYAEKMGATDAHFLPVAFYDEADMKPGTGSYCLYHGNLSVAENEEAAAWLAKEVFAGLDIPLVIAGKHPSPGLRDIVAQLPNVSVKANPTETEMAQLVANAQINVLPAINSTGVKLKIVYALHHGRFCLTNAAGRTGLNQPGLLDVAGDAAEWKQWIHDHHHTPFTEEMIRQRKALLEQCFDAGKQADKLMPYLY